MERRVAVGAVATLLVVVGAAVTGFFAGADLVMAVLFAGLAGGVVAGGLSSTAGHVGAGARAGAYGGAAGFVAFVAVGAVQAVVGGDLSVLVVGFEAVLIAMLVVPIHALQGALAAPLGVRVRHVIGLETAL